MLKSGTSFERYALFVSLYVHCQLVTSAQHVR